MNFSPTTLRVRDGPELPAELGELRVPEAPGGTQITLRLLRLSAPDPAAPTVLFLAGGPGDSGMQWAEHSPFFRAFDRVRAQAHVILLDQRGCGRSERDLRMTPPAQMFEEALATEESYRAFTMDHLADNAARLRAAGAPLEDYTPVASAHDLERLREALGLDTWTLWGYSYGTHLAQAYVKRYPVRLDKVVLCGFEGPDMTFKLPERVQEQLERLDARFPNLLADMRRAHEALERAPIQCPVGLTKEGPKRAMPVGAFVVRVLAATWSGVSHRFGRLPELYAALAKGDAAPLSEGLTDLIKGWARPLTFFLKDAASGATEARWERIRRTSSDCELRNAINFPHPEAGRVLGVQDLGDAFRKPLACDVPMLILTGSMDGFTPTENAREGIATLPNATHRVVVGAAHNDLISGAPAIEAIARFLETGEPGRGELAP